MKRFAVLYWTIQGIVVLLPCCASAQSQRGTLVGIVRNQQRETLSGAQVELSASSSESQSPIAATTTNDQGRFQFVGIAAGTYMLRVRATHLEMMETISEVEIRDAATEDVAIALAPASSSRNSTARAFDRSLWWGSRFDNTALHELPTTRRIWSLLENQETSTVTEHLDIGGLEIGTLPRFSSEGASWTANQYLLNGIDVTDPYVPGSPLIDPDLSDLSRLAVVRAAKPATLAGSGANLEMSTPRPTGEVHGAFRSYYSGRWLQSDVDGGPRLVGFPGPERLKQLEDVGMQVGGRLPAVSAPWPFSTSFSRQQLSKDLGGFPVPLEAHVTRATAEVTPFARDTRRLDVLYSGQHVFDSRDGADVRTDPAATLRRNDDFHHLQTRWSSAWGESSEFSASFGMTHAILGSGLQPEATGPSTIDLPLLTRTGSASLATSGRRARYVFNAGIHTVRREPLGSHSLDFGATFNDGRITNRWWSLAGMDQVLVNGQASEVISWNTFTTTQQHVRDIGLYVQDSWRFLNAVALSGGLRLENSGGGASGGTGRIRWTSLDPRAGLAIPLGLHHLSLRASWSRYSEFLQGRYLDFGDPSALGGQVFAWQDANGDRVTQRDEIGPLLRVFGGPHSGIDPGLQRPFTDEIAIGLHWPANRWIQGRAGMFRRDVRHRIGVTDIAAPLSSYDAMHILDLGDDPVSPSDDQMLTVYNRKAATLGQDFLLLNNPAGYGARSKGFELEISKPPGGRWGGSASFVAMETSAPTIPGNSALENDIGMVQSLQADPNFLLHARGVTYFDRGKFGRLNAYYRAPAGIWLGLVAKYYDGLPFARMLFINGFNQGPIFVRATQRLNVGGLLRTEFNATADMRVSKQFRTRHGSLLASVTVFNFLNCSNNTLEGDTSVFHRIPWAIQAPRITQIGVEWTY